MASDENNDSDMGSVSLSIDDGADHVVDERAHEKLLNSLFALDGKKRKKDEMRGITSATGSLDLVVHAKKDESKIKPQDLKMKGRVTAGHLKKPMNTMETEMAKREISRETIKSEMNAWEPVVQEIRSAPQMILSERPRGVEMKQALRPKTFQPRTPLEKELFAALGQSEDVLHPNKELTKAEERALKAMSVKEAMARRAELLKHHELLSRAQVRAKRMNKIKSKRYRKILRKEREGAEKKELERLQQTDPETFAERIEQLEKDRMEERLTLKHRGGGKFSRMHKVYSKFDDKTRDAMQNMLQKSRELTKKTGTISSSDDEDDEEKEVKITETVHKTPDKADSPSNSTENERLKVTRLDILKAMNKKAGGWLDGPKSTFVYADKTGTDTQAGVTSVAEDEGVSTEAPKETVNELVDTVGDKTGETPGESVVQSAKKGKRKADMMDKSDSEGEDAVMEGDKSEPAVVERPKKKKRKRKKKKTDVDCDTDDPKSSKGKQVKESVLETQDKAGEDAEVEEENEDSDSGMKVTMEELFEDEDVVEEFARDKAELEEKARPKIEDTRLPGWGNWAGPDYKQERPKTRKQKRAEARQKQTERERSKVQQPHVWINPKTDDAIRKLQPKTVPFPFSTVQQYEASLRQPVSRGFVRETAFKLLTKPEIVTKQGHIIKPLDKTEVFKKKASEKDSIEVKDGRKFGKGGDKGVKGQVNRKLLPGGKGKEKPKRRGIS